jgi:hypothetical protein
MKMFAKLVGHKTEAIYRRYAIVDAGALRDAAAKIDRAAGTKPGTADGAAHPRARRRPPERRDS